MLEWKLLLKTGFGNVFVHGRWDHDSTILIAEAVNSDTDEDWEKVRLWALYNVWDPSTAC